MKILVFSDSHRTPAPILRVLERYRNHISIAVHLGDLATDLLSHKRSFPEMTFYTVLGNCDYGMSNARYSEDAGETELILRLNGKKILLTHGHLQNVKVSCDRLAYWAEEKEVDACLFGHTHIPVLFEVGPIAFINPGSLTRPQGGSRPSYALVNISDSGVIKGTILPFLEN